MVSCFKAITAVSVYACVSVKKNRQDSPSRREDECVRPQMNVSCCSFLLSALPTTLGRGRLSVCIGRGGFNWKSTTFDLSISRGLAGCELCGGNGSENLAWVELGERVKAWLDTRAGGEDTGLIINSNNNNQWATSQPRWVWRRPRALTPSPLLRSMRYWLLTTG